MKFTVKPNPTSNQWDVVNENDKVVDTVPDRDTAEGIARQAMLLSGEEVGP